MKLLLATDAWLPQTNGVVTTFRSILPILAHLGVQVIVVHPGLFKTWPLPGYPEIRVVRSQRAVTRLLQQLECDAVHIATEGPIGLATRRWCVQSGRRFSSSLHTKFPEYVHERTGAPVSLGYRFLRWFHSPATTTLVTTRTQREELMQWGLQHLRVWGRGVDTELFRPKLRPVKAHPVLLNVGRVAVEKNLEAFLSLKVPGEKWVVGDGPQRAELTARYPDVRWFGYKYGAELAALYAAADVFVFPSRTDTFGLVMLEALACGTPVAAFPVTGPVDVVLQGRTGWLDDDLGKAVSQAQRIDRSTCRAYSLEQSWESVAKRFASAAFAADHEPTPTLVSAQSQVR